MVCVVGRPGGVGGQRRLQLGKPELALLDVMDGACEQHDCVVLARLFGDDAIEEFLDGLSGKPLALLGRDVGDGCDRERLSFAKTRWHAMLWPVKLGAGEVASDGVDQAAGEVVRVDVVASV